MYSAQWMRRDTPPMPHRVVYKIAAPMIALGGGLLAIGVFAAWNVQSQHQSSADLIAREVHGLVAAEDLHLHMREIRYQINLFLRSRDPKHLRIANGLHSRADERLQGAVSLPGAERNQQLVEQMEVGYREFFSEFQRLAGPLLELPPPASTDPPQRVDIDEATVAGLTRLSDDILTHRVLEPLHEFLDLNEEAIERTNEAARATAQTLKVGFLLLGICGAAAGLLLGTAIARTIGRSIVQLNVSVRSLSGKLTNLTGPVTVSHAGGLQGLQSEMRQLETDITQVVERLQQSEIELLRSEQLARVGQLAAGLAHELRNPLMPMKMLVQAAIERGEEGGLKGKSLRILDDEITRLEHSIQAFLDFARPPVPEQAPADVLEIVRATLELVQPRATSQYVQIRTLLPDQPVIARVDRGQIRQLLLNLLLNALDALESGGHLEVEVRPAVPPRLPPPGLRREPTDFQGDVFSIHDALRTPKHSPAPPLVNLLSVHVRDDGPGIPPALLESIFEPFVTTKETGTGLGLSICHRIAAAHGGELRADNRPTGGAEFVLTLPYGPPVSPPPSAGPPPAEPPARLAPLAS